jgi:hypothetical protein
METMKHEWVYFKGGITCGGQYAVRVNTYDCDDRCRDAKEKAKDALYQCVPKPAAGITGISPCPVRISKEEWDLFTKGDELLKKSDPQVFEILKLPEYYKFWCESIPDCKPVGVVVVGVYSKPFQADSISDVAKKKIGEKLFLQGPFELKRYSCAPDRYGFDNNPAAFVSDRCSFWVIRNRLICSV